MADKTKISSIHSTITVRVGADNITVVFMNGIAEVDNSVAKELLKVEGFKVVGGKAPAQIKAEEKPEPKAEPIEETPPVEIPEVDVTPKPGKKGKK